MSKAEMSYNVHRIKGNYGLEKINKMLHHEFDSSLIQDCDIL